MARQLGPLFFTGTVDGISFYKSGNDFYARAKGGPCSEQFKRSPAFEGSRRMSNELGYSAKIASLVWHGLRQTGTCMDKGFYRRLSSLVRSLLAEDRVSPKGARLVAEGLKTRTGLLLVSQFEGAGPQLHAMLLHAEIVLQRSWKHVRPFNAGKEESDGKMMKRRLLPGKSSLLRRRKRPLKKYRMADKGNFPSLQEGSGGSQQGKLSVCIQRRAP